MTRQRLRLEDVPAMIPCNWLDPILTGSAAVIGNGPYTGADVEALLRAVRARVMGAIVADRASRLGGDPAPGGKTDTSARAGAAARLTAGYVERQILEHLRRARGPLTGNRLAELSGLPVTTIRPRLTHLRDEGKVRDSGQRYKVSKRTTAIAWEPAP